MSTSPPPEKEPSVAVPVSVEGDYLGPPELPEIYRPIFPPWLQAALLVEPWFLGYLIVRDGKTNCLYIISNVFGMTAEFDPEGFPCTKVFLLEKLSKTEAAICNAFPVNPVLFQAGVSTHAQVFQLIADYQLQPKDFLNFQTRDDRLRHNVYEVVPCPPPWRALREIINLTAPSSASRSLAPPARLHQRSARLHSTSPTSPDPRMPPATRAQTQRLTFAKEPHSSQAVKEPQVMLPPTTTLESLKGGTLILHLLIRLLVISCSSSPNLRTCYLNAALHCAG
jgi:hypothetical protein